jgi:hypothetical protein
LSQLFGVNILKKTHLFFLLTFTVFSFFTWNCSKTYTFTPTSPASAATPVFTPANIFTSTPCGYPGDTCTPTFTGTPTSTFTATNTFINTFSPTATNTPTNTFTPTFTYTPTALPTVQGLFGIQNGANDPSIVWVKDTNPNVTSYKLYVSTNGVTWALISGAPIPKSVFTATYCQVNDTTQAAPFTRYYYVVSSNGGSPPDSPASPQVWAISGTTTQNTLTYSITGSSPLNCARVAGTLPAGAVNQIWVVEDTSQNQYWTWGEGGTSLTNVNFGYSGTGVTYVPQGSLIPGTTYAFGTFTLNSNNWVIDESAEGFIDP